MATTRATPHPDALKTALGRAFKQTPIPSGLANAMASALETHRATRGASAMVLQQREAVQRVVKTIRALQIATRRADAALSRTPRAPWAPQTWTDFIPIAWRELEQPLVQAHERLEAWLAKGARPPGRRGAPHDGAFQLLIAVFQALQQHGVAIRGKTGVAARVLAIVLAEADRLDGATSRERAEFNGAQWKQWVTEHHQADVLLRGLEADGVRPRSGVIKHLTRTATSAR